MALAAVVYRLAMTNKTEVSAAFSPVNTTAFVIFNFTLRMQIIITNTAMAPVTPLIARLFHPVISLINRPPVLHATAAAAMKIPPFPFRSIGPFLLGKINRPSNHQAHMGQAQMRPFSLYKSNPY